MERVPVGGDAASGDRPPPPGDRQRIDLETAHGRLSLAPTSDRLHDAADLRERFDAADGRRLATRTYHVDRRGGRSCESCADVLETRVVGHEGIVDVDLSFLSGRLRVTYDPETRSRADVDALLADVGIVDHEGGEGTLAHFDRLDVEAAFVALTFVGMAGGLAGEVADLSSAAVWGAYGLAYLFGGWYGLLGALESVRYRRVDIDVLMLTAASGAALIGAPFEGAMLLFLFSLSNVLQRYSLGRSRRAIESLLELRPDTAAVRRDGTVEAVPISAVEVDDVFVVRPGDRIPLDGTVVEGTSGVDESSLTGESATVTKGPGEEVFAGTIVEDGSLEVAVTRLAHESTIARLIHLVEEAQSERAPTQRVIDRLEQPYVLSVFAMTLAALAIPAALGAPGFATVYRAMTLMVAASPCAVIISTPAVVLSAISAAARSGVLFKGGEYVEAAAGIDAIAFDKTGTLTMGDTRLATVEAREGARTAGKPLDGSAVLAVAAAVQTSSEHHLARATVAAARERDLTIPEPSGFRATPGKGVRATVEGDVVHIGNRRYFADRDEAPCRGFEAGLAALTELEEQGYTAVLVAIERADDLEVIGWLGYTDTVRPAAPAAIERLRDHGVERVVMLTGDNERVARAVAQQVGIDEVRAELLPEQKVTAIEGLLADHDGVAMVGDGVNDAPALATASVGIGMGGAGTDVALETADIVLMADDISKLPYVLSLGNRARRTLMVNFAIAFGAIVLMVTTILSRGLALPLAVVGHEGSTVLVSLNGLRLLLFRE